MNKSKIATRFTIATCVGVMGLGVFSGISGQVGAQEMALDKCRAAVGSFVTTITDIEGVFQSRGLATITAGGVVFLNDSGQGGIPGIFQPFSSGQGAWACASGDVGEVKIKAVILNFTLPENSGRSGFGRVDYTATYDVAAKTLSGKIALHFSGEDDLESADPNTVDGPPYEEFQFTGERINVP